MQRNVHPRKYRHITKKTVVNLQVNSYTNVIRWAQEINDRPAVQRRRRVNRTWGGEASQLS